MALEHKTNDLKTYNNTSWGEEKCLYQISLQAMQ